MFSFKFRKNLLITLISLSIVLLAINILLNNNLSDSGNNDNEVNVVEIRKRFLNTLSEFGIEYKLVSESKKLDKDSDGEVFSFKVQVPGDLTIPEVLQGIYQTFRNDSLTINSIEKIKGGKSSLILKSGKAAILLADFEYSKKYFRDKGSLVFIINDADLENSETLDLIESPTNLNFLFRPQIKYVQLTENILQNSQQYSILIDDDISEQKYQLGSGFSETRIKKVFKSLITDFPNAICFIVDDKSEFYKSQNFKIFQNELDGREIKLFKTSSFVNLSNDENIIPDFDEHLNSITEGGKIIFLLNADSFSSLGSEIRKYQKKGFRVIKSSLEF